MITFPLALLAFLLLALFTLRLGPRRGGRLRCWLHRARRFPLLALFTRLARLVGGRCLLTRLLLLEARHVAALARVTLLALRLDRRVVLAPRLREHLPRFVPNVRRIGRPTRHRGAGHMRANVVWLAS